MRRSTWADTCSDAVDAVQENRCRLLAALGAEGMPLVVPNQVHGTRIVAIDDASDIEDACAAAAEGADGLLVGVPDVAALLCFADCVPVVAVSPTGRFAVVHAGWRGAVAHIAYQAVRALALRDVQGAGGECAPSEDRLRDVAAAYNVYVGPCIHAECFACGPDVYDRFAERLRRRRRARSRGTWTCPRPSPATSSARAWMPARVCDAGACTACDTTGRWYSYRASGGVCGRHGAIAFRKERGESPWELRNAIGASPQQVAQTAREAGRDPGEVRLVGGLQDGRRCRVWRRRSPPARGTSARTAPTPSRRRQREFPQARWHFIGNIQSRRIPDIVQCLPRSCTRCTSERHVAKIDEAARRLGKVQDVLLEVNVSGEESKSGVAPGQAAGVAGRACEPFRERARARPHDHGAPGRSQAAAHACFEDLARLHADVCAGGLDARTG